jgi:hypothetical protein
MPNKPTTAYLIDVLNQTSLRVKEVTIGHFEEINKAIGSDTFTVVHLNTYGDVAYVDDEGALKPNTLMTVNGYPIYGKALVMGTTKSGSDKPPVWDIETILEVFRPVRQMPDETSADYDGEEDDSFGGRY